MSPSSLSLFHPLIRKWFADRVGAPTDIQERAWPGMRGDELGAILDDFNVF